MPLLTKLQHPRLTQPLLDLLSRHGIRTWEDLVIADLETLQARAAQGEGQLWGEALEVLLDVCSESERPSTGLHLRAQSSVPPFPTGCPSLDDLLEGGIRPGTVVELAGAEGTGKTQLAASAALRAKAAVLYVDSSTSFSSPRLASILGGLVGTADAVESRWSECSQAMKCIVRCVAGDMFSALAVLEDLKPARHHSDPARRFVSSLRVLVLDSVSALAAPVLGGSNPHGHALMMHLARALLHLAAFQSMAVLVTNNTVLGDDGEQRPALGESWKAVPHVRVLLDKQDESPGIIRATLVKHTALPCGSSALFTISKQGLQGHSGLSHNGES